MAGKSKIEWTDRSDWNPIRGCTRVSPGCGGPGKHGGCYAEAMAARFSLSAEEVAAKWHANPNNAGKTPPVFKDQWGHGFAEMRNGEPHWTGKVALQEDRLLLPLSWTKPQKIFVSSTSDVFHEKLTDEEIDKIFAVMALCPQHTFQVLTKRAERMRDYMTTLYRHDQIGDVMIEIGDIQPGFKCIAWPFSNVWLGVSCERQQEADERIPLLLQTPAAVRFISAEPLLGPIDLGWLRSSGIDPLTGSTLTIDGELIRPGVKPKLDQVIAGGESGLKARPMHPQWVRSLRDQCAAAGVPFFFKQWGEWLPWYHFVASGIDDGDPAEATRFRTMQWKGDHWSDEGHPSWIDSADGNLDDEQCVGRVGKKAAGRLLDGHEWNEFPDFPGRERQTP